MIVLSIFIVGMVMGTASAAHTYKVGKYKGKITNKQYKQLKTAKKKGKYKQIIVKCTNNKKAKMWIGSDGWIFVTKNSQDAVAYKKIRI